MGLEILAPVAMWGAILIGAAALVVGGVKFIKKSGGTSQKLERSNADRKALEDAARERARTKETKSQRRARLLRRRVARERLRHDDDR